MMLDNQKRLAASVMKCSPKRIKFDAGRLDEIKEAITKADIRSLIKDQAINRIPKRATSNVRVRKRKLQYAKGKRKGHGSRKGKATARLNAKTDWITRIRAQRQLLAELRSQGTIDRKIFRKLYSRSKGGFFRSRRHIQLFIEEHGLKK
ncbi:MAG TPA: 50S ribosomal protein L19e [Candidatus Nanoarchaeia archaeon]|nr:50S ribosomal protein L19e [Candidatus Nanoarchaeia archaeon]